MRVFLSIVLFLMATNAHAAPTCNRFDFTAISYPIVVLDDDSGFPGPEFSFPAPASARCVELQVVAAIETSAPLVGVTTAGISILDGEAQSERYSVKVLGRTGYEKYANENSITVTAPVDNGRVYYRLLNLFPAGSDPSTTTGVVVAIVGVWD